MAQLVEISEIKTRTDAVNLSMKKLARRAGADPSTMYRAASGKGGNTGSTLRKVCGELEAEEIRIALHLMTLPHVQAVLADADRERSDAA